MTAENDQMKNKAQVFFQRARKLAQSNSFDYGIEMYIEGLRCDPDALEKGHVELRALALKRQVKGGKKPSIREKMKFSKGKTPLDQMLNAEYFLAKDPDHLPYAETMLKAAVAGAYVRTAEWIGNLIFQANNASAKPSFNTYILLKETYSAIGKFDKAIAACQRAVKLKPDDGDLADELKSLTAELTVSNGKYDQGGDFTKSIKNRQQQEELQAQEGVIKSDQYRQTALHSAKQQYEKEPDLPKNIMNYAQALVDSGEPKMEIEAINILENAYQKHNDFTFKQLAGKFKIKILKQRIRQAKEFLKTSPDNQQVKKKLADLITKLNAVELEHFKLCVDNYPTDLAAKYEYGNLLLRNKQYDSAIPLFQEAQKDLRKRISSMDKIGLCFFHKGWYPDAIDVFKQAMDSHEIKDDAIAKDLKYNLARSYEEQGDTEKAIELYRKIAQMDFAYKDVRQRVDNLRKSG